MQDTISYETSGAMSGRGGRKSSPHLRKTIQLSQDFTGLEDGVSRYDLLTLVKRAGKYAGFTDEMIKLLDHYMLYTQDCDWEEGAWPIVYKSLESTALDLGWSDSSVRRWEKRLNEVGAITWHDSGNHKRYGYRHAETGKIVYAFGVDLTPLAYLKTELENKLHEKQLYNAALKHTKTQISYYRRQISGAMSEMVELNEQGRGQFQDVILEIEQAYDVISYQIRTSHNLEKRRALLSKHVELHESVENHLNDAYGEQKIQKQVDNESFDTKITHNMTPTSVIDDAHINNTIKPKFDLSKQRSPSDSAFKKKGSQISEVETEPSEYEGSSEGQKKEGIESKASYQSVKPSQVLDIASERFLSFLITFGNETWGDLYKPACAIRSHLRISEKSWEGAKEILGLEGAIIAMVLTDLGAQREENRIERPPAYFNTMLMRAKSGDLRLKKSLYAALKRKFPQMPSNSNAKTTQKEG